MALIEQKGTIASFGEIREGTGKTGYTWQRQNIVIDYQVGESYTEHLVVTADADMILEIKTLGLKVGDRIGITAKVSSREWNGRWFTDVELRKIAVGKPAPAPASPKPEPRTTSPLDIFDQPDNNNNKEFDDLPF